MATAGSRDQRIRTIVVLGIAYALLWLVLSNNQGWAFGAVFIVLAVTCALSARLTLPPMRWRFLPGFLVFFLSRMLTGGTDVARRTVGMTPDVAPGWVHYPLTEASAFAHLLLSAMTGLLPGTLAARIEGDSMLVHTLDTRRDWHSDIASLESHLARLFPPSEPAS